MDSFVTLNLYCLICFVTCLALPTDINFSEQQANTAGNKIARNEDHRISDHREGCPIRYETRFGIQEIENVIIDCREWTETRCTTKTRPNCHHRHEIKCDTEYKEKCRNYVEQSCIDNWRTVCQTTSNIFCEVQKKEIKVPYEEDECTTRQEKRCEKHWEEPSEGRKVWVDNPATCKFYDTSECKDEPWEDCRNVERENCVQESFQDCREYPRTECKEVHSKVPKQVPIRVCGDQQDLPKQQGNCHCDDKVVGGYGN